MASSFRTAATWMCIVAVVALAGCFGQTPATAPPTRTPTAAPPATSAQPVGPTDAPAELEETVPCVAQAQTQTIPLSNDADGPPSGVGGEDGGGLDEGKPETLPDDPAAVRLEAPAVPGPQGGPGGVQGRPLRPDYFALTDTKLIARSEVSEPNVASDGTSVLLTWNWYAAASDDGGRTFRGMDPDSFVSGEEFCCDQLAHYVPGRNLWVWVTQTGRVDGPNRIRVAVHHGGQPFGDAIDWTYWEWTPSHGGFFKPGVWLDRPKIGNTAEQLFIAANAYDETRTPQGALVVRMPLDSLAAGTAVEARCYGTGSQPVPVSVALDTMYLANHYRSTSALLIWRWPDAAEAPTLHEVSDVDATGRSVSYQGAGYSCPRNGVATDWCMESDHRVQSAWLAGGRIGLAWNAAGEGTTVTPYPYVYGVFIDEPSLTVVDHWVLKADDGVVQYPMFAPNARGDIGGVVLYAARPGPAGTTDGTGYPLCAAVIRDAATGDWDWAAPKEHQSIRDPRPVEDDNAAEEDHPRIGDYLGVWPNGGNENSWSAGCMTYTEAGTEVEFFRFGLVADTPG